jgi:N-hydroxyarylamine O-acetyltransferase
MTLPDENGTLTPAQRAAYLDRIGVAAPPHPTAEALAVLHRAHLLTVPFENLDIGVRPLRLDLESLVEKVVGARRGGYCYELNGLFAALLRSLGYAVRLVSARVARADGGLTADFDHLALIVTPPASSQSYLVDVGFGDAFLDPIPFLDGASRREGSKVVGVAADPEAPETWRYREDHGSGWVTQYVFTTAARLLEDFTERNEWQQSSPESHFSQQRVISVPTPAGRVTLSGNRLIETTDGQRTERELDPDEMTEALARNFGVVLPAGPEPVERARRP